MFTKRSRSASARKSRKRSSEIWCFSVISVPNMAVDVSSGVIPICRQRILEARDPASRAPRVPWSEIQGAGFVLLRRRYRPDWGVSVSCRGSHALGRPSSHPASPRHPPGQGDELRRANKNPGPLGGPGRADRAASRSADDTANPRAPRDRHSQACMSHIHELSPFCDNPDRGPRVLHMAPGRSQPH
jgi:hypothetical protein